MNYRLLLAAAARPVCSQIRSPHRTHKPYQAPLLERTAAVLYRLPCKSRRNTLFLTRGAFILICLHTTPHPFPSRHTRTLGRSWAQSYKYASICRSQTCTLMLNLGHCARLLCPRVLPWRYADAALRRPDGTARGRQSAPFLMSVYHHHLLYTYCSRPFLHLNFTLSDVRSVQPSKSVVQFQLPTRHQHRYVMLYYTIHHRFTENQKAWSSTYKQSPRVRGETWRRMLGSS